MIKAEQREGMYAPWNENFFMCSEHVHTEQSATRQWISKNRTMSLSGWADKNQIRRSYEMFGSENCTCDCS